MKLLDGRFAPAKIRQNIRVMPSAPVPPGPYEFGPFTFDPVSFRLSKDGAPIALEPKALDVLHLLLQRAPAMVSKGEIFEVVWRDVAVTDNALTRVVTQLRRALDDNAKQPTYIETVATRGYRMAAAVRRGTGDVVVAATVGVPAAIVADSVHAGPRPTRRSWVAPVAAGLLVLALVGLAVSGAISLPFDQPAKAPQAVLVALESRNSSNPAISPDGGSIAYASDRTGESEIYITSLARGGREVPLTQDGGQNQMPAWSPDGRWIAYHSRVRGGIWVVPATGGSPSQVAGRGMSPVWSPDSDWLAYTTSEGGTAAQSTIEVARRDGTGRHAVTTVGRPSGGHTFPSWSWSGRFIAFTVTDGHAVSNVWVTTPEGDAPRQLTSDGDVGAAVFGPGDRDLYFFAGQMGDRSLFRLALTADSVGAAGARTLVPGIARGLTSGVSMSPRGVLAFGATAVDQNLWTIARRPDGTWHEPVRLTNGRTTTTLPTIDPSGAAVAFQVAGPGLESSVWVAGLDGSRREPLFVDGASFEPTWDARSGRVLVIRGDRDDHAFWLVDPRSKRAEQLTTLPKDNVRSPRLSPDGQTLAFWKLEANGSMNTWTQRLDSTASHRVTSDREAMYYPVWSPDGRWLAVEIKRGHNTHVGVVAADGGAVTQVTDATGQSWPHSWSPDGDQILFAGEREAIWNLFTVSPSTRKVEQITHFTATNSYVRYPSWSPTGDRIVFVRALYDNTIWTLDVD